MPCPAHELGVIAPLRYRKLVRIVRSEKRVGQEALEWSSVRSFEISMPAFKFQLEGANAVAVTQDFAGSILKLWSSREVHALANNTVF